MSHIGKNYGIVTNSFRNFVDILDIDARQLLHRIPLPQNITEPIDVVITPDASKAVVSAFTSSYLLQLDLTVEPPTFTAYKQANSFLEDVDISPDGNFAVSVDGSDPNNNIYSYELATNNFVSELPLFAQAAAISPNGNGLVLTARYNSVGNPPSALLPLIMNTTTGTLTGPNPAIDSQGNNPENITFTPDGNYAFVANTARNGGSRNIAIFKIQNTNSISPLGNIPISDWPQSIAVSRDGKRVYVLTSSTVNIFDFNSSVSPYLTSILTFNHGLSIPTYYGVDQITLDRTQTKLLVSGIGSVKVFDAITGQDLGPVTGVNSDGGIAAVPAIIRGLKFF